MVVEVCYISITYTNGAIFPMLAQVVYIAYTPLRRWHMKNIHHFVKWPIFLLFLNETPPESLGLWSISCEVPKRVLFMKYAVVKKSIKSQLLPIFMYRRCHGFHLCSLFSSSCQRWLVYILYESWLRGVFHIYTTLKPWYWKFAVCMPLAFGSEHIHCKLPLTWILGSYIRGIHHVTMIYILHI